MDASNNAVLAASERTTSDVASVNVRVCDSPMAGRRNSSTGDVEPPSPKFAQREVLLDNGGNKAQSLF